MKSATRIILLGCINATPLGLDDDCSSAPKTCSLSASLACMDNLVDGADSTQYTLCVPSP